MKTLTTYEALQKAIDAVRDGEARGLKEAAMNKRYKALFAAEDAVKLAHGMWA